MGEGTRVPVTAQAEVVGYRGGYLPNERRQIERGLREDKHWSYGMSSDIQQNTSGDQYLAVSGSVQTDKTMESMQEIMREYREFVTTRPATDDEVQRVKINRTRSLPGTFATNRGFLASIITSDSYGLPFDYAETRAERIEAVTTAAVNRRAKSVRNNFV